MTAPISGRKQRQIIKLYFEGHSLDAIRRFADVGKGTVEEVIRKLKGGEYEDYADIVDKVDVLREIAVFVNKEMDGDLQRCFLGTVAWTMLNRLGIEPSKVREWARLCEDLTPPDVPKQDFTKISMWCWGLREKLGIDLLDLPKLVASLAEKVEGLKAEQDSLQSKVRTMSAEAEALGTELGVGRDIKRLRDARHAEESQLAEAKGRTKAALEETRLTLAIIERYRVLEGTAKSKGVPVGGELFDLLLSLVASLGAAGIREVEALRSVLAKEKLTAAEGISLVLGLWRRGLTVRRATSIVRALGARGPFSKALDRLMSLFDRCGTLEEAVANLQKELESLTREKTSKEAELEALDQDVADSRETFSNLQQQIRGAHQQRDRVRAEQHAIVAAAEAKLASINADRVRAEETTREAIEGAAKAMNTRAESEAVSAELERKREELVRLTVLVPAAGRNLGILARKARECSREIQVAAYVPALIEGRRDGLRSLTLAARSGMLDEWLDRASPLADTTAKWLQGELIRSQGGALVSGEHAERAQEVDRKEIERLRKDVERLTVDVERVRAAGGAALTDAAKKWEVERRSLLEATTAKERDASALRKDLAAVTQARNAADAKAKKLEEKSATIGALMPEVGGRKFESVDEFRVVVEKILHAFASRMYTRWKTTEMEAGRIVPVGSRTVQVTCPRGHRGSLQVDQGYAAKVISGALSGAILGMNWKPGIALETCPSCGIRFEVRLEQLFGP